MNKSQIRKEFLQKRNRLNAMQVASWSQRICDRLLHWPLFLQAETVCFYYPLGNEVNLLRAAGEALCMGKQVAFPRTEGDVIRFYPVEGLSDFREGRFHVMEPMVGEGHEQETIKPVRQAGKPLLILVPGVAFDRYRNRMGYGKGYYDRYLAGLAGTKAATLGIAYECQIADRIPTEETDIPMDFLLTENGIFAE